MKFIIVLLVLMTTAQAEDLPLLVPLPNPFNLARDGNAPHLHMAAEKLTNKRTILYLWGEIKDGDSERFRSVVEATKPIQEINLVASPGGNMDEGLQIGRIVHAYKLFTHIHAQGVCVSACNFVFLGGVIRQIDLGGVFRVHMWALRAAPLVMLSDMAAAVSALHPEPKPGDKPNQPTTPLVASATVGKITPPKGLQIFGCDIQHLYTEQYDESVQRLVMQAEAGGDEVAPNAPIDIKSQDLLAQMRALAIDTLCLEETTAHSAAAVAQFIIEMRLSLDFLTDFSAIAHPLPVTFSREQLHRYNIINTE